MLQNSDLYYEEDFNSFVAGVFLTKKTINDFDFLNLINSFEETYNVSILNLGKDIYLPIYFEGNAMKLYKDIDDIVLIDGKEMVIRDYLYSVTTPNIREFLGIPEKAVKEEKHITLIKKIFGKDSAKKGSYI